MENKDGRAGHTERKKSVSIKNEMFLGGICYVAAKDLRPRSAVHSSLLHIHTVLGIRCTTILFVPSFGLS